MKIRHIFIATFLLLSFNISSRALESTKAYGNTSLDVSKNCKATIDKISKTRKEAMEMVKTMEADGWKLTSLRKNKDGTWTGSYYKKDTKTNSNKIPDGTYVGKVGKTTIENTYKDGKLIKRVVNGKEQDMHGWE